MADKTNYLEKFYNDFYKSHIYGANTEAKDSLWNEMSEGDADLLNALDDATDEQTAQKIRNRLTAKYIRPYIEEVAGDQKTAKYTDTLLEEFPVGAEDAEKTDYKSLKAKSQSMFGTDKPLQLSDGQIALLAKQLKLTPAMTRQLIADKFNEHQKEYAEKIHEERKDDVDLARQYLEAKFNGDDEKMREIRKTLGDRADITLNDGPISDYVPDFVSRGVIMARDYLPFLNAKDAQDQYRKMIRYGVGNDEKTWHTRTDENGLPVIGEDGKPIVDHDPVSENDEKANRDYARETAGNIGQNGLDAIFGKLGFPRIKGGSLWRFGSRAGIGAVEGGASEGARELIAGEDPNVTRIMANAGSQATIPTIFEAGGAYVGKVPAIGETASRFISKMKKPTDADQVIVQMETKADELDEILRLLEDKDVAHIKSNVEFLLDKNPSFKEYWQRIEANDPQGNYGDKSKIEFIKVLAKSDRDDISSAIKSNEDDLFDMEKKEVPDDVKRAMNSIYQMDGPLISHFKANPWENKLMKTSNSWKNINMSPSEMFKADVLNDATIGATSASNKQASTADILKDNYETPEEREARWERGYVGDAEKESDAYKKYVARKEKNKNKTVKAPMTEGDDTGWNFVSIPSVVDINHFNVEDK